MGNNTWIDKKLNFIDRYKQAQNPASGSDVDANANVTSKNVATLQAEIIKDDMIKINRAVIDKYIRQYYGDELAEQYKQDLKKHYIYSHDETGLSPYCCSVSLYPFLLNGLKDLGGSSLPPKHADSYIGGMINLIFLLAGQFLGAIAVPEFLVYFDYFIRKDFGEDYTDHLDEQVILYGNRKETLRDRIEDWFQQFVYSINQPAGSRNYQSPFVNISYYDEGYFNAIFKGFVFPDGSVPCWKTTKELQKMFIRWFNNERTKSLLTFPVETFNMLVDKETKEYKDKESADFVADAWAHGHSFFVYNSDSADALSSCCFSKDTKAIIKYNGEIIKDSFSNLYTNYKGKWIKALLRGDWKDARLIKLPNRPMYKVVLENGVSVVCSDNHLHLTDSGVVSTSNLTLTDALCYSEDIYSKNYKYVKIKSIIPYEYDEDIYCIEMEDISNPYFTLPNGLITHNCRLKNAIDDNVFSYTLGAGGIQTGSKKVITLNLNRITQDWYNNERDKQTLNEYITTIVKRVHKYLSAWNYWLWDLYNNNLLTVYKAGFISLDKQYLTVGVNGFIEGAEFLADKDCKYKGLETKPDNEQYKQYAKDVLETIKQVNKEDRISSSRYTYTFIIDNISYKVPSGTMLNVLDNKGTKSKVSIDDIVKGDYNVDTDELKAYRVN